MSAELSRKFMNMGEYVPRMWERIQTCPGVFLGRWAQASQSLKTLKMGSLEVKQKGGQQLGRAVEMGKLHLEINTVVSFQRLGCSSILSLETTCSRRFSAVIGPMLCLGGQVELQRQVLKDWVPWGWPRQWPWFSISPRCSMYVPEQEGSWLKTKSDVFIPLKGVPG